MKRQQIFKYPRTCHIKGSQLQGDDAESDSVPFERISGHRGVVVVEEKMDGANSGIPIC